MPGSLTTVAPPGCMAWGRVHRRLQKFGARAEPGDARTEFWTCTDCWLESALKSVAWLRERRGWKEGGA